MRKIRNATVLALLLLVCSLCFAARDAIRVIGLIELPTIFGKHDPNGPPGLVLPKVVTPIPVHSLPTSQSPIIAKITSAALVETEEFEYEAPAAVAYDTTNGWVLVRLKGSSNNTFGWISPQSQGPFHPIDELLHAGLCYLTADWDGTLYLSPNGQKVKKKIATAGKQKDITIVQIKEFNREIWVQAMVLATGRCEGDNNPKVTAKGWIPVHREDGKRNVWFYSRGC